MKTFSNWTKDDLYFAFGLQETKQEALNHWIQQAEKEQSVLAEELAHLEKIRKRAVTNIDHWNEAELRTRFIDHVTELINFDLPKTTHYIDLVKV